MRRFASTRPVVLRAAGVQALECWVAESFGARLAGLAWLRALSPGRALLLPRCRSAHTFGMRFAIDVAFLSWPPETGKCRVVSLREAVAPGRLVRAPGSVAALEAAAHTLAPVLEIGQPVSVRVAAGTQEAHQ